MGGLARPPTFLYLLAAENGGALMRMEPQNGCYGWSMKLLRLAALTLVVVFGSTIILADDRHVEFDRQFDFSKIRSFALRPGKVTSRQPDLNHSLVTKNVSDTIRQILTAKGLEEADADSADAIVDFTVNGLDFSIGRGGRAAPINPRQGGRRGRGSTEDEEDLIVIDSSPVAFTEGTLVIDFTKRDTLDLVWRGVFRDKEKSSAKLSKKLPDDAKKLLTEYPRMKK